MVIFVTLLHQLKSLADETRLRIFNLLLKHELNVNDIVAALDLGQPRVSRHLKILSDAGLVISRRDGSWVFYRAAEGPGIRGEYRALIEGDETMARELEKLKEKLHEKGREKTVFYDAMAPEWDSLKRGIIGNAHITGEIIRRMGRCGTAADLGCGTGELLPLMKGKASRVIGVDRSPRMLDEARRRMGRNGKSIELRIGELEHLPMRDGEADLAVVNMVLHHLTAPPEGIREAARVLKKGKRLIIVDLEKHGREEFRQSYGHRWLGFTGEEMSRWLKDAGFAVAETRMFDTGRGLNVALFAATKK